ncbi:MAG: limonene-1,2-epoxide hydrolase family protein [Ilumatobacteraceae bacterium]
MMTPLETVNTFMNHIESKDVSAAADLLAADISYENMPIDPVVGRDAVRQVLEGFLGSAGEVEWKVLSEWEVGSTVINERLDRFHIGGGWLELPVAGFFQVTDGLITLWRDYFDMGSYMSQFTTLTS